MQIRILFILFFVGTLFADVKENLLKVKNGIEMELTNERLKILKSDGDLNNIMQNIQRSYEALDRLVKRHPEIVKNSKLKEPQLTELKLKIMQEDEDMRDVRITLQKLHRNLELSFEKYPKIVELKSRLTSIESRLESIK